MPTLDDQYRQRVAAIERAVRRLTDLLHDVVARIEDKNLVRAELVIDIYKNDGLPDDLRDRMADLARALAAADDTASGIRKRVRQVIEPPTDRPELDHVSVEGLAFIFKDVFGRAPPDYVVTQATNMCAELGIVSLKDLTTILRQREFREALDRAYRKELPIGINPELVFRAAIHALARSERTAVQYVVNEARKAREEAGGYDYDILPDSVEDLIHELHDSRGEASVEEWSHALGAARSCAICGAAIVSAFAFAEAAVAHYDVPEGEADDIFSEIESAIYSSGVDTGRSTEPSLCTYHADMMAKDD